MSEREELVARYQAGRETISTLARAYGISRKTVYKWIERASAGEPLADHARAPTTSPRRTSTEMEQTVIAMRTSHPTWGGRKLHHALRAAGIDAPAPSTIQKILGRNGVHPSLRTQPAWTRFTAPQPNDLWQMDFKGWHPLRTGRVHPLTILDDHSRFLLGVECLHQQTLEVVQPILTLIFQRYGLPWQLLCDNGSPWGSSHERALTRFEVWMMQLDVRVTHCRAYHPQTQGKLERLHRTLKADVFANRTYVDLTDAQAACTAFRSTYNLDRPHEALAYDPPVAHYTTSLRRFPATLPAPEYPTDALVRKVARQGTIRLGNDSFSVSKALYGHHVAAVPTTTDGVYRILFHTHDVRMIDVRQPDEV